LRRHLPRTAAAALSVRRAAGDPQRVLTMPVEFARTTSGFATRRHPIRKTLHLHAGVDFAAAHGTTVRSVDEGEVEFAGTQGGYGKVVYIRHGGQRTTVYAHLSRIDVRVGEQVLQGKTIGAVGATGMATGPAPALRSALSAASRSIRCCWRTPPRPRRG
jgi:murein DD-endopeptidase MepM/ murein hydrolase activator NlpD